MGKKRKQAWQEGDYFLIPLTDRSYSVGQILRYEPQAMNSVVCAFFAIKVEKQSVEALGAIKEDKLVSVLLATRDLLDSGDWLVFRKGQAVDPERYIKLSELRERKFVGAKVIGSGIVIKLMDAYYGLIPWNSFYRADYLDNLLLSPDRKPKNILLQ